MRVAASRWPSCPSCSDRANSLAAPSRLGRYLAHKACVQSDGETKGFPTNRELVRAFALFFLTWGVLQLFWISRAILIITFLSALFAIPLSRLATKLERRGVRRGLTTAGVMLLIVGLVGGTLFLAGPLLKQQFADVRSKIPDALKRIESAIGGAIPSMSSAPDQAKPWPGAADADKGTAEKQDETGKPAESSPIQEQLGGAFSWLFPFFSKSIAAIGGIVLVIVLTIYLATDPGTYLAGFLHLVPKPKRAITRQVAGELADELNQWLITRFIAMVLIGAITTGALMLIGVKGAIALGIFAGLMEFIPFFGPIISAIPAIAIAFAESPTQAMWTVIAFLIIQQIEGNVISPLLLKKKLHLPPALTVGAVAILAAGFGALGLLIAEPLLVTILLLTKRLWVERTIGDHSIEPPQDSH